MWGIKENLGSILSVPKACLHIGLNAPSKSLHYIGYSTIYYSDSHEAAIWLVLVSPSSTQPLPRPLTRQAMLRSGFLHTSKIDFRTPAPEHRYRVKTQRILYNLLVTYKPLHAQNLAVPQGIM